MFPRVTAVLVVRHGGDHLRRTLDAIRAQVRTPDALVVVLAQADAEARAQSAAAGATHVVSLQEPLSFGEAVRAGERVLEAPSSDADALWLLAEDSAPEPEALDALLATLETAKSVAVAGPKLMEWDEPGRIAGFGRTMTRLGRSVPIVADELDQGQHDGLSDVLGLDPAAILVRHAVWQSLDGLDPALPTVDDGLDLGVRARLAGHRVAVVPAARVRFAADGVAGPPDDGRARTRRRSTRAARAAALHRRLAYAPAAAVPFHWLSFLPLAILRSIRLLLVKQPGAILGEFGAALATMFSGVRVARARRVLKSSRTVGWSAIAPLRLQPDELRRRRQAAAEARRTRARGRSHELQFIGTGGGWVLLATAAASVGLFSWLIGSVGVGGGGLLPLSGFAELWRNAAYGWRDIGTGFVGAADPFNGVLAVLGSFTFWAPSFAMVLLWLVAMPAAAIGVWFAASRLTARGSLRAVAAILWVASPPFLTALAEGRPGAVIAHVLLGWLAFAVFGAATSWAAAATASLLFAAVIAAAPSLAPALIVGWIVALAVSGRAAVRLVGLPIPALVLALPLIVEQVGRGTPLGLLADPGLPVGGREPTAWQLALGLPSGGWGGWDELVTAATSLDPRVVATVLVVPLVLAALASTFAPGWRRAVLALGAVLLGYATAVAATLVSVATVGPEVVPVWAGAGLSLAWLGLVLAAVSALDALRRGAAAVGALVVVVSLVAVVPLSFAIATDAVPLAPASERTLPAYVVAQAEADPRVTTLRMEPEPDGGLRATLEHGTGMTLDDQSTLEQTRTELTDEEVQLATVAGNLASRSGFDPEAAMREFGASFVLLAPAPDDGREAMQTEARARTALDGNAALVAVGETEYGTLWRFAAAEPDAAAAQVPADAGGWLAGLITTIQVIVIGAALLLSIPTGAGREADRRSPRRTTRRRGAAAAGVPALAAGVETVDDGDEDGDDDSGADAAEAAIRRARHRRRRRLSADVADAEPEPTAEPETEPEPGPIAEPEPARTRTPNPSPSPSPNPTPNGRRTRRGTTMRIDRRRALRIGGRTAGFLAAAALAVGTVAAAALVPWPDHRVEAPSVLVQPAESRQQRVCPGPLLALGEDAAAATTASSVGSADLATAAEPADAALEEVPLAAPGNPNAAEDGAPVAIAAEPGGVDAGMLAGAQSQGVSTETLGGFAAAACGEAVADAWLVAGATNLGRSGLVLLSNPTAVAATVDVRVSGEAGPVEAPSALGIIVPPGSQRVLSLAGLAPNLTSPVVHVTSTGGAIAASLETSVVVGLAPAGIELTGVTAAPATSQVIPGLVVPQSGGVEASEDHADGDDFPAVRLFAPGDATVDVSIGVVPESGSGGSTIEATLQPGSVTDVPLGVLDEGAYTVRIEADQPVVAAARATVGGAEGQTDAAAPSDLAWTVATAPLLESAVIAVPPGPSPTLHLVNPGGAPAQVTLAEDGAERTVEVPAAGALSVSLDASSVVLTGTSGLHATVSFASDDELAAFGVQPPGALDSPIRVYPN